MPAALLLALALLPSTAVGNGFLNRDTRKLGGHHFAKSEDLKKAMESMLGCGNDDHGVFDKASIKSALMPIWRSIPKNAQERVEWRLVRYMTHRYFMQQSAWMVRGFEPSRKLNNSDAGHADILSKQAPALVDMMLGDHHAENGYSLEDAVSLVATLQQLVFNSESALLERIYLNHAMTHESLVDGAKLRQIFEDYVILWMMESDEDVVGMVMENRTLLHEVFPHWGKILGLLDGEVKKMSYDRQRAPTISNAKSALTGKFSFDAAHTAVAGITRNFASFWETECQNIKSALVNLDKQNTGRVKLKEFYGANLDGQWHFGESEDYLRELGALDESSRWRGKEVIIPNYMQAASNCIISTSHYLVCCVNECEDILGEIEEAVGAPFAEPAEVLGLVGSMTSYEDVAPKLQGALTKQLSGISEASGGKIPLHGRLFAQWLHYAFPRECPFPHKAGTAVALTPNEFGDKSLATKQDMKEHASKPMQNGEIEDEEPVEDLDQQRWMSQWSEEEELVADYAAQLRSAWGGRSVAIVVAVLLLAGLAAGGAINLSSPKASLGWSSIDQKSHLV